ncbi:MAG: hypothetical protein FJ054_09965 [Cyanobacteria bacterium M_surface_10_m2_119]|nr:hypothetical protein [Cyanobacteria bacterium M_surface_10_m2_119]
MPRTVKSTPLFVALVLLLAVRLPLNPAPLKAASRYLYSSSMGIVFAAPGLVHPNAQSVPPGLNR